MELKNKTVLISGASAGIGAACVSLFAQKGAKIIALARRPEKLRDLIAESGSGHILPLIVDVTDRKAVQKTLQDLPDPFSQIDILINNAGLAVGMGPAQEAHLDDWEKMVDTNIKGVLNLTNAILPGMAKRKHGHIINMGSVAATYPYPGGHVYGATKAFIRQFSLNLRADLLGTSVRITNIEPGMVETEFSVVRFDGDEDKARSLYANMNPLTATDIAESVLWAASQPSHVNINNIEIMPTNQAFGAFPVYRGE